MLGVFASIVPVYSVTELSMDEPEQRGDRQGKHGDDGREGEQGARQAAHRPSGGDRAVYLIGLGGTCPGRSLRPRGDPGTLADRLLENRGGWSKRPGHFRLFWCRKTRPRSAAKPEVAAETIALIRELAAAKPPVVGRER